MERRNNASKDRLTHALIGLMPGLGQQLILLTQYLLHVEDHLPGSLAAMAHLESAQEQLEQAIAALDPASPHNGHRG
jgi:hypothetical protein